MPNFKRVRIPLNDLKRFEEMPVKREIISLEGLNEVVQVLTLCESDNTARLAHLSYKISVLEKNLHVMPSLNDGIDSMKNETNIIIYRQTQIKNLLENIRLNDQKINLTNQ